MLCQTECMERMDFVCSFLWIPPLPFFLPTILSGEHTLTEGLQFESEYPSSHLNLSLSCQSVSEFDCKNCFEHQGLPMPSSRLLLYSSRLVSVLLVEVTLPCEASFQEFSLLTGSCHLTKPTANPWLSGKIDYWGIRSTVRTPASSESTKPLALRSPDRGWPSHLSTAEKVVVAPLI